MTGLRAAEELYRHTGVCAPCGDTIALATLTKELGTKKLGGTYQYPCRTCGTEVVAVFSMNLPSLIENKSDIRVHKRAS